MPSGRFHESKQAGGGLVDLRLGIGPAIGVQCC